MAFTKLLRWPLSIAAIVLALTSDSSGASLLATDRITGMIGSAGPCVRIRKWPVTRTAGTKIRPSRAFPLAPVIVHDTDDRQRARPTLRSRRR